MLTWHDLLVEGDPHPRRFDSARAAHNYLTRIERLSEDAADTLVRLGVVNPPLARREYRLRPLEPSES